MKDTLSGSVISSPLVSRSSLIGNGNPLAAGNANLLLSFPSVDSVAAVGDILQEAQDAVDASDVRGATDGASSRNAAEILKSIAGNVHVFSQFLDKASKVSFSLSGR